MAIKARIDLKSDFENGKQATAEKFKDLIDSSYNVYEDSLLQGPLGMTGKTGLWLSGPTAPTGPTSNGIQGEVIVDGSEIYICYQTNSWIKITGDVNF